MLRLGLLGIVWHDFAWNMGWIGIVHELTSTIAWATDRNRWGRYSYGREFEFREVQDAGYGFKVQPLAQRDEFGNFGRKVGG